MSHNLQKNVLECGYLRVLNSHLSPENSVSQICITFPNSSTFPLIFRSLRLYKHEKVFNMKNVRKYAIIFWQFSESPDNKNISFFSFRTTTKKSFTKTKYLQRVTLTQQWFLVTPPQMPKIAQRKNYNIKVTFNTAKVKKVMSIALFLNTQVNRFWNIILSNCCCV